jgi:hypothetical protein
MECGVPDRVQAQWQQDNSERDAAVETLDGERPNPRLAELRLVQGAARAECAVPMSTTLLGRRTFSSPDRMNAHLPMDVKQMHVEGSKTQRALASAKDHSLKALSPEHKRRSTV